MVLRPFRAIKNENQFFVGQLLRPAVCKTFSKPLTVLNITNLHERLFFKINNFPLHLTQAHPSFLSSFAIFKIQFFGTFSLHSKIFSLSKQFWTGCSLLLEIDNIYFNTRFSIALLTMLTLNF